MLETISIPNKDSLYFVKGRFKDGMYLTFYSHSPWGCTQDQIRGWAVIDARKHKIIDEINTYYFGNANQGWHDWRKKQKEIHGTLTKLKNSYDNEDRWKMNE